MPDAADTRAKVVLYGPAYAPFTEKVRRALLLKGLEYELREPQSPEDFRRWNPETGLLPVADVEGERVADSTLILLRLDERFPEPPLLSRDPQLAARQRQLEDWADETFLWHFAQFFRARQEREQREARRSGRGGLLRRFRPLAQIGAWLRAGGTWERPETAQIRGIADRLDDLVKFLGSRTFFHGDAVSMADLGVYGMLYTLEIDSIPGSARLVAERPSLVAFMRRVEASTGEGALPATPGTGP